MTSIVKVYDSRNGKWLVNAKVTLGWDGIANVGHSSPAYTNSQGIAEISHASSGTASIFVNGKEVGKMQTPGSASVTV